MSVVRQTQTVNTISRITQRTTTKVTAPQTLLIATQMKVRNRRSPSSSTATVRSVHKQTQPGFSSLFSAGGAFSVDSFSVFVPGRNPMEYSQFGWARPPALCVYNSVEGLNVILRKNALTKSHVRWFQAVNISLLNTCPDWTHTFCFKWHWIKWANKVKQ